MKPISLSLSVLFLLFGGACYTNTKQVSERFLFRVSKVEFKTSGDENIPEYANGLFWISAVCVEPIEQAGKDFRFGCQRMPENLSFEVGRTYRSQYPDFVSFNDWSHRYETIKYFKANAPEVFEVSISEKSSNHNGADPSPGK